MNDQADLAAGQDLSRQAWLDYEDGTRKSIITDWAGGTSGREVRRIFVYQVHAVTATPWVYDCHLPGESGGGTMVVHWQEYAQSLVAGTYVPLSPGTLLLTLDLADGALLGISGLAYGKVG